MLIKDKLEIFIITYNRKKALKRTFEKVFHNDSPIANFKFTILDNNSNDGTDKVCKNYCDKFKNIKYIKNNRNIGLPGNICRAAELVKSKYLWILADDDIIVWDKWDEIENAIGILQLSFFSEAQLQHRQQIK